MKIRAHVFVESTNVTLCGKTFDQIDTILNSYEDHPERFVPCSDCTGEPISVAQFINAVSLDPDPRCEADVKDGVCLTRLPSWDAPCPNEFIHLEVRT